MQRLLHIDTSPSGTRSRSRALAQSFASQWTAARANREVEHLDLAHAELPEFDAEMIEAKFAVLRSHAATDEQRRRWGLATRLARQFNAADVVLISTPVWNFGLPYRLKHYIDVVTLPEENWRWTRERGYEPLLSGKTAVLAFSSANDYPDDGSHAANFAKQHLRHWLGFLGIRDVHVLNVAPTLDAPEAVAQRLAAARETASALARRL
jgi:FMN-dependent NADH-azoreductase